MVLSGMRESHTGTIDSPVQLDVDPDHFSLILSYIYGQSVEVNSSNIVAILALSSSYSMSGLTNRLSELLAGHITVPNCAAIYATADAFSCQSLKQAAQEVLFSNFAAVSKTEGFLELNADVITQVNKLFFSPSFNVSLKF
jgi:kelch-like protein 12